MKGFNNTIHKRKMKLKIDKPNPIATFAIPFVIILIFFILLPMIMLFIRSVVLENQFGFIKLTFDNFTDLFTNKNIFTTILRSFKYAFIATAICLVLGYPFAYFLTKVSIKYRGTILLMITATMWINTTLRLKGIEAIINLPFLEDLMLQDNGGGVIIGLVYIYLPFMIIPIYTSLIKIEKSHIDASNDLGASPSETFMHVTFPLSFSGVLSGITMVLLPTATTIVVPKILSNASHGLFIGQYIEEQVVTAGNYGLASAISLLLAGIITVMSWTANRFDRYAIISDEGE